MAVVIGLQTTAEASVDRAIARQGQGGGVGGGGGGGGGGRGVSDEDKSMDGLLLSSLRAMLYDFLHDNFPVQHIGGWHRGNPAPGGGTTDRHSRHSFPPGTAASLAALAQHHQQQQVSGVGVGGGVLHSIATATALAELLGTLSLSLPPLCLPVSANRATSLREVLCGRVCCCCISRAWPRSWFSVP
jgi:hypothetical protein